MNLMIAGAFWTFHYPPGACFRRSFLQLMLAQTLFLLLLDLLHLRLRLLTLTCSSEMPRDIWQKQSPPSINIGFNFEFRVGKS
jgi:hypothetical protein